MKHSHYNDAKYWKWGLIYYNLDNPDLFVEKRVGIGQAFNFAHPKVYYLLFFITFFPTLVIVIPLYLLGYL